MALWLRLIQLGATAIVTRIRTAMDLLVFATSVFGGAALIRVAEFYTTRTLKRRGEKKITDAISSVANPDRIQL